MKKLLVLVVCFLLSINVLALDGTQADDITPAISSNEGPLALDEQSDQDVIISPQDPAISSIIERMDEAQTSGDVALFRQLLSEYKTLTPPITVEEGPQVDLGLGETVTKPLWSDGDIEVDSAFGYQGFSMDTRDESRIYLAASRKENLEAENVIRIWYSDNSIIWNEDYTLFWLGHELYDPSLKIVETPDTDYIFVACEALDTSNPYDCDILLFRINLVSGASDYFFPAENDSIDEMNPSLDANDLAYPTSPYLHLAFESGNSIAYIRSLDLGETWVDRAIIASGSTFWDYYEPSLAYGPSSENADSMNLGIAWTYYQESPRYRRIRFRKNRWKGQSADWLPIEFFTPPANCFDDKPSLKMTHGTMNSATIVFARRDTTRDEEDLWNTYTYDAGRTWNENRLYTGGAYEVLNTLAMDDSPNDYHVFFKGNFDDIRYKEAHYDSFASTGWTYSIGISDTSSNGGDVANYIPPASAVLGDQPCVCWRTDAPGWKLMFDALWLLSGISDPDENFISLLGASPAVFAHQTDISYYLSIGQNNITLEIYDALGRSVKTLASGAKAAGNHSVTWNGDNDNGEPLANGIYLCVLKAGDNKASKKITLIK